ncbi:ComEC/Rec2 family competence protein [Burkholderia cepacia]|uniref:ComEC/Rec2 family competence protein n=1 Tax=Burkholderia cepacia TaxID=292 RepID=UPI00398ED190
MSLAITVLPASHGDSILIRAGLDKHDPFRILIDGGPAACYQRAQGFKQIFGPLHSVLRALSSQSKALDLVVLTHVDSDHIGGLLKACESNSVLPVFGKNVWFNSGRVIAQQLGDGVEPDESALIVQRGSSDRLTSITQGVAFDDLLDQAGVGPRTLKVAGQTIEFRHGEIQILSPDEDQLRALLEKWEKERPDSLTSAHSNDYKLSLDDLLQRDEFEEDTAVHNASSIAFLISSGDAKALFLGDAFPSTVCASLRKLGYSEQNPLRVGACKVSHHGSKGNTSPELLSLIRSDRFIVSTDGSRHGLPNKVTFARIMNLAPHSKILFNYPELKTLIFNRDELAHAGEKLADIEGDIVL